jgi:colicin import membrane protein
MGEEASMGAPEPPSEADIAASEAEAELAKAARLEAISKRTSGKCKSFDKHWQNQKQQKGCRKREQHVQAKADADAAAAAAAKAAAEEKARLEAELAKAKAAADAAAAAAAKAACEMLLNRSISAAGNINTAGKVYMPGTPAAWWYGCCRYFG